MSIMHFVFACRNAVVTALASHCDVMMSAADNQLPVDESPASSSPLLTPCDSVMVSDDVPAQCYTNDTGSSLDVEPAVASFDTVPCQQLATGGSVSRDVSDDNCETSDSVPASLITGTVAEISPEQLVGNEQVDKLTLFTDYCTANKT